VTANAGDAVLFDRRLWHARSDNYSPYTRKAMFFGYTFRWIAIWDHNQAIWSAALAGRLSPVQRSSWAACPAPTATTPRATPCGHPAARLAEGAQPA
jgi:hypothetical protein